MVRFNLLSHLKKADLVQILLVKRFFCILYVIFFFISGVYVLKTEDSESTYACDCNFKTAENETIFNLQRITGNGQVMFLEREFSTTNGAKLKKKRHDDIPVKKSLHDIPRTR